MKVLVISHNVFDNLDPMGKTLSKFFDTWDTFDVAQLYTYPNDPISYDFCSTYYRITDIDIIKSFKPKSNIGTIFDIGNPRKRTNDTKESNDSIKTTFEKGRKGTPLIHILRDTAWKMGKWYNKKLKDWIKSYNPDIIFLATGNYEFIYNIAYKVSIDFNIPIVSYCCDDYYIDDVTKGEFLSGLKQKHFMKTVKKVMKRTSLIVSICEPMAKAYSEMFNIPCKILYTPADSYKVEFNKDRNHIAYFGKLGLKRDKSLIEIGRTLKSLNIDDAPKYIDVYTSEWSDHFISELTLDNGIVYHKAVSQDEMLEIYRDCSALIFTESFDNSILKRIKYSISTKIPEALSFGPLLISYGPSKMAGIDYLIKNNASYVITENDNLEDKLIALLSNEVNTDDIVANARKLANLNHNKIRNSELLKKWLSVVIEDFRG